ncbi:MAG TPA: MFS transporter [Xanthobacteraceae bacterium]|jgi:sugar phosphate permease
MKPSADDSVLKATNLVLLIICLMYFITYIDRVNIATAAPPMQKELGLSNTQLGIAISAFAYPYAFFQIAGGWLGDRLGPRMTLLICGTIWSAATVLIGFVEGAVSLVLARLLLGIGEGSAFPTATRALASWVSPQRRGFAQGITHSFARLGNAVSPAIIAVLIVWISWRGSFIVVGLVSFVWVAVWWLYFRDDPRHHGGVTTAELAELPPAASSTKRDRVPWWPLLRRMLPVTFTDFCYGWTLWVYLSWLPSFFLHNYQLNLKQSALFSSGVLFAGVVGDTVGGLISDGIIRRTGNTRAARVSVIFAGFLGSFLFMLPVLFIHDLVVIALCLSAAFFFAELIVAPIWAVPMDIAPRYSGTASGFMNFGFGLAGMISPVVFGAIIDATGRWDYPFVASLCLLLVGAVSALFLRPDIPFQDPQKA